MDKYEYNAKLGKINELVNEEDYEEAAKVADTIEWKRVRNVRTLCMVSEIYEADGRLEDSKEILLRAYRRSPNARAILYRLVEICVKMKEFDDAVEFYTQYVQSAPNDNSRYILKYKIYKGRGSSLEDQIAVLEEYKNKEYTEKWAYELAKLYQRANMPDKCVEACDDLALWFHNGKYVIKALELKKNYAELTPEQQHVYDQRNNMQDDEEVIEEALLREQREKEQLPKLEKQIVNNVASTNLADNIIAATEREIAESVMQHTTEQKKSVREEERGDSGQEWDLLQKSAKLHAETVNKALEESSQKEKEEREKFEQRFNTAQLQEELAKSMRQIVAGLGKKQEDLVESSNIVQPTEAGTVYTKEEKAEISEEQQAQAAQIDDILTSFGNEETVAAARETEKEEKADISEVQYEEEQKADIPEVQYEEEQKEDISQDVPAEKKETDTSENGYRKQQIFEKEMEEEKLARQQESRKKTEQFEPVRRSSIQEKKQDAQVVSEKESEDRKIVQESKDSEEIDLSAAIEAAADVWNLKNKENEENKESAKTQTPELERGAEPVQPQKRVVDERVAENKGRTAQVKPSNPRGFSRTAPRRLSRMQEYYFPFFREIPLLNEQIAVALENARKTENDKTSRKGNVIILGNRGSGRSTIGIGIAKALAAEKKVSAVKVAKIYAADLNKKDIPATIGKISGGVLIIEEAGDLNDTVIETMTKAMDFRTDGLVIILEDEPKYISDMLKRHPVFKEKFNSEIVIPIFTNEELLMFGKIYALDRDYKIAQGAEEELYNRIREGQTDPTQPSTIQNVKKIMDAVIKKVEKGGLRKITMGFSKKRYDEEDRVILFEKDFK
ncbi:MAG: tetratricopeptide repeat protein [Lachnospiraceae bacterium]|nr:tetratricopeptide repeat protein [Robinsoniella sp.]MDY3766322.1 tetratricopeptide repeat protein [Lachnospiraceae bacterium]